jgi:hypothetical protein
MGEKSSLFSEADDAYRVNVQKNHYTRLMYEGVSRARRQSKVNPDDLLARLYPITDSNGELIEDSAAETIGKPKYMPWAEVPVISAGRFYGLISADKLNNVTGDWEQMLEADLDALDALAQLAGRAFAIHEKRGMLIQSNLRILDECVTPKEDLQIVERRILLFATHGDEGLGFSRAFIFRPHDSQPNRFVFANAVGSINIEAHENIAAVVRAMPLKSVLKEASLQHDSELNTKFRGFEIVVENGCDETQVASFEVGAGNLPQWVGEFWKMIKVEGKQNSEILVAPMISGDEVCGVLIVDREWDDLGIIQTDRESLASYARYCAEILLRHRRLQKRLDDIRTVVAGLTHEPGTLLANLRSVVDSVPWTTNHEVYVQLNDNLNQLVSMLEDFRNAFEAEQPTLTSVAGSKILVEIKNVLNCFGSPNSLEVAEPETWEKLQLMTNLPTLKFAFRNLVRNSIEAYNPNESKMILTCNFDHESKSWQFSLLDNGPGLSDEVAAMLNEEGRLSVQSLKKKCGLGISFSRIALARLGGTLKIVNGVQRGVIATITLPLPGTLSHAVPSFGNG